jgi:hypothetical protein
MLLRTMALFSNSPEDWQRLDWQILRDGGIALYWRPEYLADAGAEILLDVMAHACRFHLLNGRRFVTLVQTENPNYRVGRLGSIAATWNRREWLDAKRRPESRTETS